MFFVLFSKSQEDITTVGVVQRLEEVDLKLTFEPPWEKDMMSEEAKLELGML